MAQHSENWSDFKEYFTQAIKQAFEERGLNGVTQCVLENLEEWNSVPLNVAVIGSTGAGKSSFINTFLSLMADDEGAAEVNVTQCTMEPTPYCNPEYPNLKMWDLPGVGTPEFERRNYLQQIEFRRYDFFLLLSHTRFTEDDIWLAKEVHKEKKRFYFIRTKIDIDISNYKKSQRRTVNESEKLDEIREDCRTQLNKGGVPNEDVFLIENYAPMNYDFDELLRKLVVDAPVNKKDTMALSFSVLTKTAIERKAAALEARISKIALLSATGSALPIPGVGLAVDAALMLREATLYRKQFGLNEESLQKFAETMGESIDDLKRSLDLQSTTISLTTKGIVVFCRNVAAAKGFGSISTLAIPVVGSFISGSVAYWSTGRCLQKLLELMRNDALKVNEKLQRILADSTSVD